MPGIKALWQRLFGDDTPTHHRRFLERRIAYRLQEVEFRKVDANLAKRNKSRIASLIETGKVKKRDRDYRPAAGSVLACEYQGVEHRVIVTQDSQYDFQDRLFPCLSMNAREITDTRWSGPLFSGLKAPATPKTAAKKEARQ